MLQPSALSGGSEDEPDLALPPSGEWAARNERLWGGDRGRWRPCLFLPQAPEEMDWRSLAAHRGNLRDEFYLAALTYAQFLWMRKLPARAILCLDRAMGADPSADCLRSWPVPFASMRWILERAPVRTLVGNPRIHFQHYATRMNSPRTELRRWRAWACWAIARVVRPEWPGDARQAITEPSVEAIGQRLRELASIDECALWESVHGASPDSATPASLL